MKTWHRTRDDPRAWPAGAGSSWQGGRRPATPLRAVLAVVLVAALAALVPVGVLAHEEAQGLSQPEFQVRNIRFNHLSVADGLSHAAVMAIEQDHRGYMWFGTQDGLNRYDGREVVSFLRSADESGGLPHNWIWSLHSDPRGYLWIGTDGGGLSRLHLETGTFTTFSSRPDDPAALNSDRIRTLVADSNATLWIGTDGGGLTRYEPKTGRFRTYRHDPADQFSLPHDAVLAILEDRNGVLWVGTNGGGLARLDRTTGRFHRYQHDATDPASLGNDRVRSLLEGEDGRLWVGTYEGGLNRLDIKTGRFERFEMAEAERHGLSSKRVRSLYRDRNDTVWVGTENGLFAYVPSRNGFDRYANLPADPSSLSDDRVSTIFQDRGGVLWVGTFGDLNAWNYLSDAFQYLTAAGGHGAGLGGNVVTSIAKDEGGHLWVGTYDGGLSRVGPAGQDLEVYRHEAENPLSLPDNRVMAVLPDGQYVWVGTRTGGLARLDRRSGEFRRYQHDSGQPGSLSSNRVSVLSLDPDGTLWVGTYGGGLNRLAPGADVFQIYRHDPALEGSLGSDRVLDVLRDRNGTLWVGTESGGLNRLDETSGGFAHYRHDPGDPDSLGSDTAWRIAEGDSGSLWVGTLDGGLNHLTWVDGSRVGARIERYGRSDGLLSDTVYGLERDDEGLLWISSSRGLTRFDPLSGSMRHFDRRSGLRDDEFNFGAHLQDSSGKLFFGGPSGLVQFYPKRLVHNAHKPPVALRAGIGGEIVARAYSSAEQASAATLDYRDRRVTFSFAAMDFASPDKNVYRYRLRGFDEAWREGGDYPQATYTNLPADHYTFEVLAANNDGVWSDRAARIDLRVRPAPWRSNWAFAGYAGVLLAVILVPWQLQRRKVRVAAEQRMELARQVQERTGDLTTANQELERVNNMLVEASVTDSLTGLKNRRYLDSAIDEKIASIDRRCSEHSAPPSPHIAFDITPRLFFMMIDLDGFKAINDSHGHHAGDLALIQVSEAISACCRPSDLVIRWGGDEFLVVGESGADRAVEKLAENIRLRLGETKYALGGGHVGRLSASVGFALYPFAPLAPELMSWERVAALADFAAYVAKRNGRNAWVGLYGRGRPGKAELEQFQGDVIKLVERGFLELHTSLQGPMQLAPERREQQAR